jgi:exopolysaccharide biosynthesis polyprenyl glycosylphosphotransferase
MPFTPRKDFVVPLITVCSDIIAIEIAFLASYWIRFQSPLTDFVEVTLGYPPIEAYVLGSVFVIPVWLWLFNTRGMYNPRRNVYFSDEFFAVVRLVFLGMLVVMSGAFFFRAFSFSRLVFAILGGTAVVSISLGRYAVLKFEQSWYRTGHDIKRAVVVGMNESAHRVFERINAHPSLGYAVVGFFSPTERDRDFSMPLPHLGAMKDVAAYAKSSSIDTIFIALHDSEHAQLYPLVQECEGFNIELMLVPDILELLTSQVKLKTIEGIPFIPVKSLPMSTWNQIVKRTFDLVVALFLLVVISPLFALLALLVKLTSPGPIFFAQERVGLDGSSFRVLKFRSMRADAEHTTGPVWAQKNDPRATSVGMFLRRFSLDELPQLFNVLKGEMSLVGPRPERPYFVEQFKSQIPKYLDRHRVKTGMTGWAQVNGLRGNSTIEDRTKFDVYYVENWSLVFDVKIILKTVRAVLFGKDAY